MKLNAFRIGETFACGNALWRCTDVGTRVVVAVDLRDPAAEKFGGPPYAVVEHVFDENDLEGCAPTLEAWREEFGEEE